jgi:aspartate aminotransferase
LHLIHDGLAALKKEGFSVDVLAPEAAIYLTIKIDLTGKKAPGGVLLKDQAEVTSYLLNAAGLAVVPFSAFGASKASPWYRLSVGPCKLEDIPEMFRKLREAMEKLS